MVEGEADDPEPQLLLFVPPGAELAVIEAAVRSSRGSIAGVIAGDGVAAERVAELGTLCREERVASFVEGEDGDADGVILRPAEDVAGRRRQAGETLIIGARAGLSRHDAMVAGEDGADFVLFEHPDGAFDPALAELVAWWSELFVLPCAAWAEAGPEEAGALREAGASFLVVDIGIGPERLDAVRAAFTGAPPR